MNIYPFIFFYLSTTEKIPWRCLLAYIPWVKCVTTQSTLWVLHSANYHLSQSISIAFKSSFSPSTLLCTFGSDIYSFTSQHLLDQPADQNHLNWSKKFFFLLSSFLDHRILYVFLLYVVFFVWKTIIKSLSIFLSTFLLSNILSQFNLFYWIIKKNHRSFIWPQAYFYNLICSYHMTMWIIMLLRYRLNFFFFFIFLYLHYFRYA
jgi:hypothetical protein